MLIIKQKGNSTQISFDQYVEQYMQEQEKEKAVKRAEKERLTNAIKEKIKGHAQNGWELAYKLCNGLEDNKSKELRYKLFRKIPNLSLQEKIDICKQYLTLIENSPEDNKKSNVYLYLADLSSQSKLATVSYDLEESSYYLDRWFSLNDDQLSSAEIITEFCIKHRLEEDLISWIKKYEDLCMRDNLCGKFILKFLKG